MQGCANMHPFCTPLRTPLVLVLYSFSKITLQRFLQKEIPNAVMFSRPSLRSRSYLVCGYTDMRKSIDGLRAIVEGTLKLDSKNHSLFLFCGRRCDRIKALIWEGDGYVLLYKRLDVENGRYRWPRDKSEARNLTWQQFDWLMSGIDIEQPTAIRIKRPY